MSVSELPGLTCCGAKAPGYHDRCHPVLWSENAWLTMLDSLPEVPEAELGLEACRMRASAEYLCPERLIEAYASVGVQVVADPFSSAVAEQAIAALRHGLPFSIVRIGDGEANLLSFGRYPGTPILDQHNFAAIIEMQQDRMAPDLAWAPVLRELIFSSVLQADVVGVIGLWRPRVFTIDILMELFREDRRGGSGHWRALDLMLKLAREGLLRGKIVASAYLYLGILEHIPEIVSHAREVLLVTDRAHLASDFARRFGGMSFEMLNIGKRRFPVEALEPSFLQDVDSQLPQDMSGYCCMIGAGPWAEVYCSWVRQRGGVAIDLGSGFDILDGIISRPVHRALGFDRVSKYALRNNMDLGQA